MIFFVATQTDLEFTIPSKSERQIPYDITYMWNLKNNTNELNYKTETGSAPVVQRVKDLVLPQLWWWEGLRQEIQP